jgi:hypothetical protein
VYAYTRPPWAQDALDGTHPEVFNPGRAGGPGGVRRGPDRLRRPHLGTVLSLPYAVDAIVPQLADAAGRPA